MDTGQILLLNLPEVPEVGTSSEQKLEQTLFCIVFLIFLVAVAKAM